jgi:hypothetical protein
MNPATLIDTISMTDPQLVTLAFAIIIPLSLLLYSNGRITEAKETLRAEMRAGFDRLEGIKSGLDTLSADMRELRREAREDRLTIDADIKLLTGKVYELMGHRGE